jgi:hypothetical protein
MNSAGMISKNLVNSVGVFNDSVIMNRISKEQFQDGQWFIKNIPMMNNVSRA